MKLLVDMNYIMFRSMHASTSMTMQVAWSDRPISTGSAKLAFSTIMRAYNKLKKNYPNMRMHDIVITDDWGRSFRKDIYEGYKKKRGSKERTQAENDAMTDMFVMKNLVMYVFYCLNARILAKKGYEADDVLGYTTRVCTKKKIRTTMLSSDSDLAQLINDYSYMIRPEGKDLVSYTPTNMDYMCLLGKKKIPWGCKCRQDVLLYKALAGDSTDEYPGVPGFGDAAWLAMKEHMDVNGITSLSILKDPDTFFLEYSWVGNKQKRVFELYTKHKDKYTLSLDLANIRRGVKPSFREPFYRSSRSTGPEDCLNAIKSVDRSFDEALEALSDYQMRDAVNMFSSMSVMGVL